MKNYYKLLQVDPEAEQEVIEAAFRRLARKYHPDVNEANATAHMQALNEAWYVLRDPERRRAYNTVWVTQGDAMRIIQHPSTSASIPPEEELPPPVFRSYWQDGAPEEENLTRVFAAIALLAMGMGILSSILLYLVYT